MTCNNPKCICKNCTEDKCACKVAKTNVDAKLGLNVVVATTKLI